MKKLLLSLALLAPLSLSAEPAKKKDGLTGIWQLVEIHKADGHEMRLPVWKVLQSDGAFYSFLIANQTCQTIINNQGTYKQTSDSTYVEHITGTITDEELIGKANTITYHFLDKDRIEISYQLKGTKFNAKETWVRVKLELPE